MSEELESLHARINRSLISEEDFVEAENYAKRIDSAGDLEAKKGLIIATIICYGRPFSMNERKSISEAVPRIELDPHEALSEKERALHDLLVALRNKVVAHSEYQMNPVSWSSGTETGFSFQSARFNLVDAGIIPRELEELCRKRKKQCMDLSFQLNLKLAALKNAP
jgi:hypothetical protein